MKRINALTIAGTDPSGGAGIQADLKTFSALGAYGTSVITALVVQNTCGVQYIHPVTPDLVSKQLDAVLNDIRIDVAKIGMLFQPDIVEIVAERLKRTVIPFIVLDTVMVAKSGDSLLSIDAINSIRELLLPHVSLITPNLLEAAALLECTIADSEQSMLAQGEALINLGCKNVLIKGGHLKCNDSIDLLITHDWHRSFITPRVNTLNTHGTGCSLSAALAALRPRYINWLRTMMEAKSWLQQAIIHADSLEVGKGNGPIHHFYKWW